MPYVIIEDYKQLGPMPQWDLTKDFPYDGPDDGQLDIRHRSPVMRPRSGTCDAHFF